MDFPDASRIGLLVELGLVEYGLALEFQRKLNQLRATGEIPDTLVLVEHPPVITVGRNADCRHLLVSRQELVRQGIGFYQVERGGGITFHNPGQLVGYPVFLLRGGLVGVRGYVERLQQALVRGLALVGVAADVRGGYVGVWVKNRKIASIGVAVKRGVSLHGFALNVSNQLDGFRLIVPCGLAGVEMTSVEREGGMAEVRAVREAISIGFCEAFGKAFQTKLPRSLTSLINGLSCSAIAAASWCE
ncbi:MAG: lipoyl(octanoyl) transferase LipB [candidate division WOR-3 bacterium]